MAVHEAVGCSPRRRVRILAAQLMAGRPASIKRYRAQQVFCDRQGGR